MFFKFKIDTSDISNEILTANTIAFDNTIKKLKSFNKKPNILICGYTGAGKTSIIQALLGEDLVPDNKIGHEANPMTQDYDRYENELIGIWDSNILVCYIRRRRQSNGYGFKNHKYFPKRINFNNY